MKVAVHPNITIQVSKEESIIIVGRSEALKLLEQSTLSPEDKIFFQNLMSRLPEESFKIVFNVAAIPWAPVETITGPGGWKDKVSKAVSRDTLPAELILLLGLKSKLKKSVATLEHVKGEKNMQMEVTEKKTGLIGKLLKNQKIERRISISFTPYGLSKHKTPNVVFGHLVKITKEEIVEPVKKTVAPSHFHHQLATV